MGVRKVFQELEEVQMTMIGGLDVHRQQITFDYVEGATSPDSGVMNCTIRADRKPCAHAAWGERCRARTWWSRSA